MSQTDVVRTTPGGFLQDSSDSRLDSRDSRLDSRGAHATPDSASRRLTHRKVRVLALPMTYTPNNTDASCSRSSSPSSSWSPATAGDAPSAGTLATTGHAAHDALAPRLRRHLALLPLLWQDLQLPLLRQDLPLRRDHPTRLASHAGCLAPEARCRPAATSTTQSARHGTTLPSGPSPWAS